MNIKCGELKFNISGYKNWNIPQNVEKFIVENGDYPDLNYNIEFVNSISKDNRQITSVKQDLMVGSDGELETRYLFIKGANYPYAKYTEVDDKNISVEVLEDFKDMFELDTMFWSLFALERHMIQKKALVFHCGYNSYKNHAILFSGPSGIGKSTQSDLWKENRGAEILNGDKCLLLKDNDAWCADGWPVCGSSEICINQRTKLGNIVFLNQGKENTVNKLGKVEAVKKIISQLTINYWNLDFVNEAFTIVEDIVNNINIYELICTPDVRAVEVLEKCLEDGETWIL